MKTSMNPRRAAFPAGAAGFALKKQDRSALTIQGAVSFLMFYFKVSPDLPAFLIQSIGDFMQHLFYCSV